jgi:hypothetical protein
MTAWGDLIDAGYSRVLGLAVEGIPYAFLETRLLTTADVDIAAPAGVAAVLRGALRVRDSDAISSELDRVTGLAGGRAVDFVLALDVLAAENVVLFKQPTLRTKLTADLDGTATTVQVESTTGWPSKASFYLGRERIDYDGVTATSFLNCVRAVAGWAHYHPSSTASGYRFATDTPLYWRGRLVTLYEHLVGPDGRALAATANTVGAYCRELWKGYLDAQPQIDGRQMLLRTLPVHRLLAQQLGGTAKGEVLFTTLGGGLEHEANPLGLYPIYVMRSDRMFFRNTVSGVDRWTPIDLGGYGGRVYSLQEWGDLVMANLGAGPLGDLGIVFNQAVVRDVDETHPMPIITFQVRAEQIGISIKEDVTAEVFAWFANGLEQDTTRVQVDTGVTRTWEADTFTVTLDPNAAVTSWVVVKKELEADGQPLAWPTSGYVLLEAEEGLEVAAYDQTDEEVDDTGLALAVRLSQRALMGTMRVNPWASPTRITVLPGARGTISEVIRTVATSSGTGERGVYDTLAYGLGQALPDLWFDVNRFPLNAQYIDGVSDDAASVENVIGGWLALLGYCLTQRQGADGYVRIEAVPTTLDLPGEATSIFPRDVLVGNTQAERLFETPNVVRIEDSLRERKTVSVVRDVPRQQAEGARSVTVIAPGVSTASALIYGGKMLALSDGQIAVTLPVRAGLDLHVGDPCRLVLEHPAIWDWTTGAVSQDMPARVIGEHESLGDGTRQLTFLVAGQQRRPRVLCPAARVTGWLSSTLVQVDDTTGFAVGHKVRVYRRGDDTTFEDRIVGAVNTATILTLTVAVTTATFPADGDSWVTYDSYTDCTVRQQEHLFVRLDQEFEA